MGLDALVSVMLLWVSTTSSNVFMAISIRGYRTGDEQQIVGLFEEVFGFQLSVPQWRWKYPGMDRDASACQVAEDADGAIIGHAGAVRLRGCLRGKDLDCYQICDVMVRKSARGHLGGRNLFTRLIRSLLEEIAGRHENAFAYGFPGERPFLLGERAGAYSPIERIPEIQWHAGSRAPSWLRASALIWGHLALDRLWLGWERANPGLYVVRDGAYLRWRYRDNPFRVYELLGIHVLGFLFGWAVVCRAQDRRLLVDLLIPRRLLKSALAAVDRWCEKDGGKSVHLWLPQGWRGVAQGMVLDTPVVATNMIWGLPLRTEQVMRDFYYTMGDADIF